MADPALVQYAVADAVATVTLDSPRNRNALSTQLVRELLDGLGRADRDPEVRMVVLTHTGGTFCAGADLSEASSSDAGDPVTERGRSLLSVLRTIVTLGTPVVGRIDGHVRAGGMGLVGACDLVVAGPAATFALTEARLGLAASVISVVVLPRLSGRQASRLFLAADKVDAAEAAEIGLVTWAADDPDLVLAAVTKKLRAASPQGLRESKALVNHDLVEQLDAATDRVVEQSARLFASEDAREGMLAFLEKRSPKWSQ
ncbi:enoyl-CoA hydratase family protein [Leekyejoonella antrihumi]|uniref:Enoyl-CoA hydratase family protein n=1 Tax=Leekyejoonella antrihumi TaxID=1660198 RepID=A0A563DVI5_9MICO|nr:enoyl-CoA hydratase family protein [Leekyejoonella antrihumi]TWP33953.1 enoyl-CoA hydratase family protein [Leekyejoonella antrihumi]